jgi:hypothetical protein
MGYDLRRGLYPYPLSYLASDGGTDTTQFIQGDPTQANDEQNWYVICVTPEQWTQIKSSMQVGAPIAYPDSYGAILQLIWQANEFPNQFYEGLCVDLCSLILECIQTNESIQREISGLSTGYVISPTDPPLPDVINSNILDEGAGCNLDNLFGACTGLTDLLNDWAEQFIAIMQDNQNTFARVAELIEVIPGIGEIVPADIVTLAENFVEDMATAYDAAYSPALRDQIRCDLFCMSKDTCEMDFGDIFDYFRNSVSGGIAIDNFEDFIGIYITGQFTGNSLVFAWNTLCFGAIAWGSEILGVTEDQMYLMVRALFNDPDPDWSILCDCGWVYSYDFPQSFGAYNLYDFGTSWVPQTAGALNSNAGLNSTTHEFTPLDRYFDRITIQSIFDETTVTSVTVDYDVTMVGTPNSSISLRNNGVEVASTVTALSTGSGTLSLNTNVVCDEVIISVVDGFMQGSPPSGSSGHISNVTINGTGTKPSQF